MFTAKDMRNEIDLNSFSQVRGASWVWQDVVKSAKNLQLGVCLPVSTRSALKIWENPWIPSIDSYKPPKPPNPNPNWPSMVKDLTDQVGNTSMLDVITEMFPDEIVNKIKKIQILDPLEPINSFWAPSKSGNFSAKAVFNAILLSKNPPN
ncbi:UNVERIFIED_CONTAM: hypothetical protein Sradi_5230800 [Sesamum radiatum]|uniref:Uncharacterized protein n=1 Tax=Sesamum radiatum TaxID=300843 RepID=A0AAW2LLY9_SESRA